MTGGSYFKLVLVLNKWFTWIWRGEVAPSCFFVFFFIITRIFFILIVYLIMQLWITSFMCGFNVGGA